MEQEPSTPPTVAEALADYERALEEGGDAELKRAWQRLNLARLAVGATADPNHNPHDIDRKEYWRDRNIDGVQAPSERSAY